MKISVNTKKMAVIGDPIGHSMSPFMHNTVIEANGFDAVYFPFHVKEGEVEDFCKAAKTLGFSGFNATMPHKQVLLDLVDEIDPEAKEYASINTVKITEEGKLIGYNTDVRGLLMAFEDRGVKLSGAKIMIIGAGGVAGALVKGCGQVGAGSVTVLNRTFEKAAAICDGLSYASAMEQTPENMRKIAEGADVIVNCTSLGMHGVGSDFADLSFLDSSQALLCDLIYNPWETKFLAYGRERGLATMNGMAMLIYQGLLAFEKFMDVKLDCRAEYERLLPLCEAKLKG
ncbi:MAG: shikimate dehydrogenase [Firmicutes bacterium]|nr:shikimate dehydrogenase [Bacillota bacterium]